MKKTIAAFLTISLWVLMAFAAETTIRDGVPERYTVQKGDTLWEIAAMFLNAPWKWPEVWSANPQIDNPDLIYPGDVISLVYVDGQPRLMLERNGVAQAQSPAQSSPSRQPVPGGDGRTVKLTPQIRETPHEEPIPALPLEAVNNFLSRTRVVAPGVLETAPYVVAGQEKRLVSGGGDDFYVRGPLVDDVDFYGIYKPGDPYVDMETGEILGVEAEDIGSAQLKARGDSASTFKATRSRREIRVGNRLLPHEERRLAPTFFPHSPDDVIHGKVIRVEGGVSQVGTLDVVAINRGEREGLETGHVLAIHKAGEKVKDRFTGEVIVLPSERAGLMMIFRTFEKMSFGLVLTADRPLAVNDEVRTP